MMTYEANERLAEITREFESKFQTVWIYDGRRPAHLAPTGEKYIVITDCGIHEEGIFSPSVRRTSEDALASFEKYLSIHATLAARTSQSPISLYWRVKPEIDRSGGWTRIYSRFLVSDKPVKDANGEI